MKKLMTTAAAGLVLCALACPARAAGFSGVYTYKLVLRNDWGFVLNGVEAQGENASANYNIEVYSSSGVKLNAQVKDATLMDDGQTVGYNCTVSVPVGEQSGSAKKGERLTLVVTPVGGSERFRSSKVLPPVGGTMGFADAPVGVFWSDSTDTDNGWDAWLRSINSYLPDGMSLGGPDEDYDGDGFSNLREYQLGTDPAGGALGLVNKPEFSIVETDGVYRVSFNYGWGHVYSIRAIEGTESVGRDGHDFDLYESLENLNAGTKFGMYFYDSDYNTGTKEFYVKKPELGEPYIVGLAVDGRLQEYIQVGSAAESSLEVAPGSPLEYASESEAMAAKAIAGIVPSEAVAAVLTGDGMVDAYKAMFTTEVLQQDDKWILSAELTPQARTNLMENVTAATQQIPVGEVAQLSPEATTNVVLTGCTPGFYYSLYTGTTVTNLVADAGNSGVLCGADGVVEFPTVSKPGEDAGFYKVSISIGENK